MGNVRAVFWQAAYLYTVLATDPSYAITVACAFLQLLRNIKNKKN